MDISPSCSSMKGLCLLSKSYCGYISSCSSVKGLCLLSNVLLWIHISSCSSVKEVWSTK